MTSIDTILTRRVLCGMALLCLMWPAAARAQDSADRTAQDNYAAVQAAASAQADSAFLVAATGSDLDFYAGTTDSWLYVFGTPSGQLISVIKQGDNVAATDANLGSNQLLKTFLLDDFTPAPVTGSWVDSDEAVATAEAAGGTAFRTSRSQTSVEAVLVSLPATMDGDLSGHPVWVVTYASATADDYRVFIVDATNTAVNLQIGPSTATQSLDAADIAALAWAEDAELVEVATLLPDLSSTGEALVWAYTYYSASGADHRTFYGVGAVDADGVVDGFILAHSDTAPTSGATQPLPAEFLNSDEAVTFVDQELVFGDPDGSLVQATLTTETLDDSTESPVWIIAYTTASDVNGFVAVYVDADDGGSVSVGVEEPGEALPRAFTLGQNYPNPFNPSTLIEYSLKESGNVRLTVYDALGRKVRQLVSATQPVGEYKISWDGRDNQGRDVASGVYLYRLDFGGTSLSRTMVLLR